MDQPAASSSAASASTGEFQKVESQMSTLNPKGSPTEIPSSGIITDSPKFAEEERLADEHEENAPAASAVGPSDSASQQHVKTPSVVGTPEKRIESGHLGHAETAAAAAQLTNRDPFIGDDPWGKGNNTSGNEPNNQVRIGDRQTRWHRPGKGPEAAPQQADGYNDGWYGWGKGQTPPSQTLNIYCHDPNAGASGDGRNNKGWTERGAKGASWHSSSWGSAGQDDQAQLGTRPAAATVSQPAGSGVTNALRSHLQNPDSQYAEGGDKYVTMADLHNALSQYLGQSTSRSNCLTSASCNGKAGA